MKPFIPKLFSFKKAKRVKQGNRLLFLFIMISVILLSLIIWWLIFNQQNQAHLLKHITENLELKRQLLAEKHDSLTVKKLPNGILYKNGNFLVNEDYLNTVKSNLNRKSIMFLSESLVVFLLVLVGVYLVYRSFKKELSLQKQEKNFLLSITHELKTPIASVKLYLQTIQNRSGITKEKKEAFIEKSLIQLNRLNNLINNILLSSKGKLAQQKIEYFDLATELQEILADYSDKYAIKVKSMKSLKSYFSKQDFSLIVNNLVKNACQHGFNEEKAIEVELFQENGALHLKCIDHGKGIPQDEKASVLKRFYRLGSEETREQEGSGLGLYIVDKIVSDYKGKLDLLDQNGGGLCVHVCIPLRASDAA